ncbi:MAG: tyrosine-protein phosphatase, partial [Bacilli bacterium]
ISEDGDVTQPMEKSYREFVASSFGVSHYRQFFHVLLSLNEGSVLFHCADGKDRAGIAAALILLALGVSKEDVIYDYLKTNEYTNQKALNREDYLRNEAKITNEKVIQSVKMLAGVKENWLLAALDEIDKTYQGIDNYLHHQMELSDDDLQKLRDKFLD